MTFNENPYYSPELCGLKIFWSIDTGASYEFDTFVIFERLEDKALFYDQDAGCSCPTPFDPGRHDLKEITAETFYNFKQALENHYNISHSEINQATLDVIRHFRINFNINFKEI